ncbi:hypothetical protein [Janthinobacterium fluminis]|uniref:Holin n=1 Tax=Janthinobacterium fluminis TaxID=2987524 RepID=A0ABT5K7C8_9BURK|nr:hypothetical protein [Janthinobacterium fluminis]MDC8760318.1 hypothetical protein [Janthinobacterium fluminis]
MLAKHLDSYRLQVNFVCWVATAIAVYKNAPSGEMTGWLSASLLCIVGGFAGSMYTSKIHNVDLPGDAEVDTSSLGDFMMKAIFLIPIILAVFAVATMYFHPAEAGKVAWVLCPMATAMGSEIASLYRRYRG